MNFCFEWQHFFLYTSAFGEKFFLHCKRLQINSETLAMSISGRINIFCVIFMICIILNNCFVSGRTVIIKRSISPDENVEHTDDSVDRIRYDEYPVRGWTFIKFGKYFTFKQCNLRKLFLISKRYSLKKGFRYSDSINKSLSLPIIRYSCQFVLTES